MKSLVLSFVLINTAVFAVQPKTFQLELVQALFRHGDRTPDKGEVYKTDPYDPKYYESTGYGQLTKVGMQREYQIGQVLRKLYKDFLGEFKYDKVYAYSTDFDRTKASLQLVLAGLFPPPLKSAWNDQLMWTPIPTNYKPIDSDFMTSSVLGLCEGLLDLQEKVEKLPEYQKILTKYQGFLEYVRNKTEIGDAGIFSAVLIANNLRAVRSMGLKLPSWCSEQDYEMLSDILALCWELLTMTPELRKQIAGPVVKQLLENMKNHTKDDERKIYLYSGHDINVAPYTGAHNFTGIPASPDFGSTVIIEKLRGIDNESYVRMFLWTGVSKKLIKLKLENCDYECPLSVYEEIMAPVLPNPDLVKCISGNTLCAKQKRSREINPAFRMSHAIAGADVFTFKYGNEVYVQN